MTTVDSFITNYIKEIQEDNAAIFAGAGMSVSAGYVTWKDFLREIAQELQLDIDRENDLVAIAQYHVNENNDRSQINQRILEKFAAIAKPTEVHNILARLPIKIYWTTNYDSLIEDALKKCNKKVDIKIDQRSLANNVPKRDAVVYKMHGDILIPADAVITKDDYEAYNEKRQLFTTTLQGDLVSKTFLFIGFSFEDPNLNYILSRIRVLLGENKRTHYAILRKNKREDYETESEFEYSNIIQKHKIEDLKRYSINAVMINDYHEIPLILSNIEKGINKKNVFISGSAEEYGHWSKIQAVELISKISDVLIKNDFKIVSGFGLGIGSFVINSVIQKIDQYKNSHYDSYLKINPFPFQLDDKEKIEFYRKYRNRIISECGIAIFLFGNKNINGKTTLADGVFEEYQIAKNAGAIIIPIGTTGYATEKIFQQIYTEKNNYPYLADKFDILGYSKSIDEITKAIEYIINNI